jgi:O-antigen/teichoic acid export membrane protein
VPPAADIAATRARLRRALRSSQTGTAAGLAAATLANNAIQVVFTIVFTRVLGTDGYGALAALIAALLVLIVTGQSIQAAAARATAMGHLGDAGGIHATMSAWARHLALATLVAGVVSVLLREPIAHVVGVPEHPWAAAAILPTGVMWTLLSLQRGVMQGLHVFKPVGGSIIAEGAGRIVWALALVAAGAGVTGAFLGSPLAFVMASVGLAILLRRRVGAAAMHGPTHSVRELVAGGWVAIGGLVLLALLQNVDLIVAKHVFDDDSAGAYAAASVAAKSVVFVAIGVGLHLLPEATRRLAAGEEPRGAFLRALGVLAVVAVPSVAIFAAVPGLVLRVGFGAEYERASGALALLGGAMVLLAISYLTVQYLLALHEPRFLVALGALALAEPLVLTAGDFSLATFAAIVLALQVVAAATLLFLALRARPFGAAALAG